MLDAMKALPPLRAGITANGRIARLEVAVDRIIKFLANMEPGDGISFRPTKNGLSITIESGEQDDSFFPAGNEEGQVLRWDNTELKWKAGWVTAVGDDPDEQIGRTVVTTPQQQGS